MCNFIPIVHCCSLSSQTLRYVTEIFNCYNKYSKYLCDDFAKDFLFKVPFLWAVTTHNDEFMGFVFLDNFVGNEKTKYSAELTTCFERKAWGIFTRYSAKIFLKKVFDEFGLYKIKAQIYPDNFRISKLLKSSGFEYESTLKQETLRNGKPQDIDVYSLYRSYYYKKEVKK